jgi:hypothetical protein
MGGIRRSGLMSIRRVKAKTVKKQYVKDLGAAGSCTWVQEESLEEKS